MKKWDSHKFTILDEKANELFISLTSQDNKIKEKAREDIINLFKLDNNNQQILNYNNYLAQLLTKKVHTYLEVRNALNQSIEEKKEDSLLLQTLVAVQIHTNAAMSETNQYLASDTLLNKAVGMIGKLRGTESVKEKKFKPR